MAFSPITTRKQQFKGNGSRGPFFYNKFLLDESELMVVKTSAGVDTTLVAGVDFTSSLVKKSNGVGYLSAEINLTDPLLTDEALLIDCVLPFEQPINFVNGQMFDIENFEAGLDRVALLTAQVQATFSEVLRLPEKNAAINTVLQSLGPLKYLRFSSNLAQVEAVNVVDLVLSSTLPTASGNVIVGDGTAFQSVNAASARISLGLGSVALQASGSVSFTSGSISLTVPLAIDDGGTGANNASDARTNLGVQLNVNVQPYSAELNALASYNTNGLVVRSGTNTFVGRSFAVGTGLSLTNADGVAGNPSISYNVSGLTEETSPLTTDVILTRKNNGDYVKVPITSLPSYNTAGAPSNASYITVSSSVPLSNERVLTAGSGISLTDAGANSTLTTALNINGLSLDSSPDLLADFALMRDANTSTDRKVLLNNIKGYDGYWTLIQSQSFSNVSSVDFTTGLTGFDVYALVGTNVNSGVLPSTSGNPNINWSINGGANWSSAVFRGTHIYLVSSSTTTSLNSADGGGVARLTDPADADVIEGEQFIVYIYGTTSSNIVAVTGEFSYRRTNTTASTKTVMFGGRVDMGGVINAIRLGGLGSTSSGRVTLYGLK